MLRFFSDKSLINIYTLPFLVMPFFLIIRNWGENYFIIAFPDLLLLLPIIYFSFNQKFKFDYETTVISVSLFLLILFSIINLTVQNHLSLISLVLFIREIILPLLFLIVFLNVIEKTNSIALNSLKISIASFFAVSFFSLLNYFGLISYNESFSYLNPYVSYGQIQLKRDVFNLGFDIYRLNPLMGGAIGSIAAISLATSIFILKENLFNNFFKLIISIVLLTVSFLTQSFSVIPIIILAFYFLIKFEIKIFSLILFLLFILFFDFQILNKFFSYFKIIFLQCLNAINNFTLPEFLFGLGPRFFNNHIAIISPKLMTDSGIFRIFFEFGIIVFILKIFFLFNLIFKFIKIKINTNKYLYLFFLFSFLIIIHGNIFLLKPLNLYFYSLIGYIYYNIKVRN